MHQTAFSPGNANGVNDEFFVFPNDYVDEFEILSTRVGANLFFILPYWIFGGMEYIVERFCQLAPLPTL